MCTAATYATKDFYFGRTLDYEFAYGEGVTVIPRNYIFNFRHMGKCESHYAMIGMAHMADGYPLYYDGINEKGVGIAGLNFVGNARYAKVNALKDNVAQFEFIPWILSKCASIEEVWELLKRINITDTPYSDKFPCASLHWIIADRNGCVVVECMEDGMHIYDNPAGVLTNNPPFDMQMFNLNNYMQLSSRQPDNKFSPALDLKAYSRGMGAMGLPGDLSSVSRFVRAAYVRANSLSGEKENESVSQFFHILGSVDQQRGCCEVSEGKYEITIYTACANADRGIYYYTTYNNHQITAVDMHKENLDSDSPVHYGLIMDEQIKRVN